MPDSTPHPAPLSLFDGKVCTKCGQWRPFSLYWKQPAGAYGLFPSCKLCRGWKGGTIVNHPPEYYKAYKREWQRANQKRLSENQRAKMAALRAEAAPVIEKQCRRCGEQKPATEFWKRSSTLDGLHPHCKACASAYTKSYKQENRERLAECWQQWYHANLEYVLAKAKERYDPVKNNEWRRLWCRKYPEKKSEMDRRRRNRKLSAPGFHTGEQWLALKAEYEHRCLCCGKQEPEIRLTEDHIVALTQGGSDDIANIQPLCLSCNSSKGKKTIDYRPFNASRSD